MVTPADASSEARGKVERRRSVPALEQAPRPARLGRTSGGTRDRQQQEETRMLFIIWLIVGGVIGWLASLVMRTNAQQGVILNIVVGILGAFIGGFIFNHDMNNYDFSLPALLEALVGAIILLAIVNLIRRGSAR
jgi:uncharacterized membrane protein YeaQ/YmgE (transglycosylase-associated protein family)